MKSITIYGPGCAKCTTMAKYTQEAMRELHLNIPMQKVTDPMQFAVAGVLLTPALSIDGKVIISGTLPTKDEIKGILQKAMQESEATTPATPDSTSNCCCRQKAQVAPPSPAQTSCACDSKTEGCCSSHASRTCPSWKKAIIWIILLILILAGIKMLNRQHRQEQAVPTGESSLRAADRK